MKTHLSNRHVEDMANHVAATICDESSTETIRVFGIPRGGVPVAYLLAKNPRIRVVEEPYSADILVDDIIDSGRTMRKWREHYPHKPFYALIDKVNPYALTNNTTALSLIAKNSWVVFPWEGGAEEPDDSIVATIRNRIVAAGAPFFANDNISAFIESTEMEELQNELIRRAEHFLQGLVIDVAGDHNTKGTAKRMAKMYLREVFRGRYSEAPNITDFPNAKNLDEVYVTGPITVRSACSHHFVPIIGKCWIGIIPSERVIGLSKFNRIVDWIASRPQIQEELVTQIADYIDDKIKPKGIAVVLKATHMCMTWRGVKEPMEAAMTTSIMRGAFRTRPEARGEFMSLISGNI